jgi:hypothetical protein
VKGERPVSAVPRGVAALLALTLGAQIAWQATRPAPVARAEALGPPLRAEVTRAFTGGEAVAAAQIAALYLQAFDNQPGVSVPFQDLDYARVEQWLTTMLDLDSRTQYPLMMASQLYAQVPVAEKQRAMLDFVHRRFLEDPAGRWRWLAHAVIVAKHRLRDPALALRYADDLARLARRAPGWARQMRIFILEDMGEREAATIVLGGLLAEGDVTDPQEIRFLTQRLEALKAAENSSPALPN